MVENELKEAKQLWNYSFSIFALLLLKTNTKVFTNYVSKMVELQCYIRSTDSFLEVFLLLLTLIQSQPRNWKLSWAKNKYRKIWVSDITILAPSLPLCLFLSLFSWTHFPSILSPYTINRIQFLKLTISIRKIVETIGFHLRFLPQLFSQLVRWEWR